MWNQESQKSHSKHFKTPKSITEAGNDKNKTSNEAGKSPLHSHQLNSNEEPEPQKSAPNHPNSPKNKPQKPQNNTQSQRENLRKTNPRTETTEIRHRKRETARSEAGFGERSNLPAERDLLNVDGNGVARIH